MIGGSNVNNVKSVYRVISLWRGATSISPLVILFLREALHYAKLISKKKFSDKKVKVLPGPLILITFACLMPIQAKNLFIAWQMKKSRPNILEWE